MLPSRGATPAVGAVHPPPAAVLRWARVPFQSPSLTISNTSNDGQCGGGGHARGATATTTAAIATATAHHLLLDWLEWRRPGATDGRVIILGWHAAVFEQPVEAVEAAVSPSVLPDAPTELAFGFAGGSIGWLLLRPTSHAMHIASHSRADVAAVRLVVRQGEPRTLSPEQQWVVSREL